ncbi:MAG TPA: hypothetical protein VL426_03970 [Candidatus Binatia bacterium]|jgi:hypothetical protein|nr:hypothetical protein [Candidatus Binatia bacterium]
MAKLKKEQQQVVMLVVVLVIIAGVLIYFYRDKFLPRPTGEAVLLTPPPRMTVPPAPPGTCQDDKTPCANDEACKAVSGTPSCTNPLYKRDDFKSLKRFGDVPVRPLETGGSPEPFASETEAQQ